MRSLGIISFLLCTKVDGDVLENKAIELLEVASAILASSASATVQGHRQSHHPNFVDSAVSRCRRSADDAQAPSYVSTQVRKKKVDDGIVMQSRACISRLK